MRSLSLEERRRRILTVASQEYAKNGFHKTGMRQLCTALGMSPGALYRYFPGKESIIEGIVEMDREMIQQKMSQMPADATFMEALEFIFGSLTGDLAVQQGLPAVWNDISSEATRNPAVAVVLSNHYRFIEGRLTERIEASLKRGELSPDTEPLMLARFVTATMDGMLSRASADPSYPLAKTAEDSLDLLARAIGAKHPGGVSPAKKPAAASTATRESVQKRASGKAEAAKAGPRPSKAKPNSKPKPGGRSKP